MSATVGSVGSVGSVGGYGSPLHDVEGRGERTHGGPASVHVESQGTAVDLQARLVLADEATAQHTDVEGFGLIQVGYVDRDFTVGSKGDPRTLEEVGQLTKFGRPATPDASHH